jgi:hypothetical protein
MDTAADRCYFVGVARIASGTRQVFRMGIIPDPGMAIGAAQTAVYARSKLLRIHGDTLSCCVLEALVRMAGQAIHLLGMERQGQRHHQQRDLKARAMFSTHN